MKLTEERLLESSARSEYKPLTLDEIKQILEDHEKGEKWDILENASTQEALVKYAELEQENKKLEGKLEDAHKYANALWDSEKNLKERIHKMEMNLHTLPEEYNKIIDYQKQKLESETKTVIKLRYKTVILVEERNNLKEEVEIHKLISEQRLKELDDLRDAKKYGLDSKCVLVIKDEYNNLKETLEKITKLIRHPDINTEARIKAIILNDGYEWKEGTRKLNKLLDSQEKK